MIFFFRTILLWAALAVVFSESAFAQAKVPGFDSFSYTIQGAQPRENDTRSEVPQVPMLSEKEGVELQRALEKAISQILKLTLDYEALRTRIQSLDKSIRGSESKAQPKPKPDEHKGLDELKEIHARQLSDRDKQLSALIIRLDALQIQYDQENESRLQAENQLTAIQQKNQEITSPISEDATRSDLVAEQLERHRVLINQLELELGTAQEVIDNLLAERQQLEAVQTKVQDTTPSRFAASNEWVIEGLEFDQGSANIEQDSIKTLDAIVAHLKQNPKLSVQVNGYTDSSGSAGLNLRLSQARADAVATFLIQQGIESGRVNTLGYGARRPLGDNALDKGRLLNRRVAVLFFN